MTLDNLETVILHDITLVFITKFLARVPTFISSREFQPDCKSSKVYSQQKQYRHSNSSKIL